MIVHKIWNTANDKLPKIAWITAQYMLQVDLPLLKWLKERYEICWYVVGNPKSETANVAINYASENGIALTLLQIRHFIFNPLRYIECRDLIKEVLKSNADIFYFNISTFPFLLHIIKKELPADKVVIAMHHGGIHHGMRFKFLYRRFLNTLNRQPFFLQYYSESQGKFFKGTDNAKKYVIPLALNDFGKSEKKPPQTKITFLSFGNIIPTKNIKLLIETAQQLPQDIQDKVIFKIVGHCRKWETEYAPLITKPELFDIEIRRIPDNEIPDLFSSVHYLILPYSAVTQSGPLRIAYGYNLPVIASDLEGFKESIVDNISGHLFQSENMQSLSDLITKLTTTYPNGYIDLRQKQKQYIDENLSIGAIINSYVEMFNSILNK